MKHELFVGWSSDSRDHAALLRCLVRDNPARGGPSGHRNIAIIVKDPDSGEASSGVWGSFHYGWLLIELLYVADSGHRQDLGSPEPVGFVFNLPDRVVSDRPRFARRTYTDRDGLSGPIGWACRVYRPRTPRPVVHPA